MVEGVSVFKHFRVSCFPRFLSVFTVCSYKLSVPFAVLGYMFLEMF